MSRACNDLPRNFRFSVAAGCTNRSSFRQRVSFATGGMLSFMFFKYISGQSLEGSGEIDEFHCAAFQEYLGISATCKNHKICEFVVNFTALMYLQFRNHF